MSLPTEMRHISYEAGGPELMHVTTGPVPTPKAGEVLIRVMAAGVNRPDVQQRKGAYPPPPGASPLLGLEVAGEVAALGDGVTGIAVRATRSARWLMAAVTRNIVARRPASACHGPPATTRSGRRRCRRRISRSGPICSISAACSPASAR